MSRSKKQPYYTDQNTGSPGEGKRAKRQANRRVRAEGKKATKEKVDIGDGKWYRKVSDSWSIRDWSFYCPKDKKAKRK